MKILFFFLVFVFLITDVNAQDCFSIGSLKSAVRAIQGTPSAVIGSNGNETWRYEFSSITFSAGKVAEYSNISNNLNICNFSKSFSNLKCFRIGSTKDEVSSVQGTPSSVIGSNGNETWRYEFSSITFKVGKVIEYSNISNNLNICNLSKSFSNLKCFRIGSTKDEVSSVQGTPSSVIGSNGNETWRYEFSSLTFNAGKVAEYSNISNNLKICLEDNTTYNSKPDQIDTESSPEASQNSTDEQDIGFDPFIGQITSNVIFRTDPSQSSIKIKTLNTGSQVYIYSRNALNGYYKAIDIMTSSSGWIHKDFVNHIEDVDISQSGAFQSTGYTSSFNSEVKIRNKSSYSLKIVIGKETFTVSPNSSKTVNINPGKKYFIASAPGVMPASGYQSFESNNGYEWEFWVSTTKY